jgi:hypothetical protein
MAEGIRWLELAFNDTLACIAWRRDLPGDGGPSSPQPPKAGARRARLYGSLAPGDN